MPCKKTSLGEEATLTEKKTLDLIGRTMSLETKEEVAECHRKVAAFQQRAETASTPAAKAFYTALENGYRRLAIYKEGLD